MPDDARSPVGRRLPQQHVPHVRAYAQRCRGGCSPGRGATWPRPRAARPEHRRRPRDHRLLRRTPARRADARPTPPAQVFVRATRRARARPGEPPGRLARPRRRGRRPACARRRSGPDGDATRSTARGPRRRRRGGVELVCRRAAVGPAPRPARRRRPVADATTGRSPSGHEVARPPRPCRCGCAVDRRRRPPRVKLCDVFPTARRRWSRAGSSNLSHRGCWPVDPTGDVGARTAPLMPGEWIDVTIELEATTWTLDPGHALRLAIAGTDWPNCWPPPGPLTLEIDHASIALPLPSRSSTASPIRRTAFVPGDGPAADEADGVVWRIEHDVLGRRDRGGRPATAARYEGLHGVVDRRRTTRAARRVDRRSRPSLGARPHRVRDHAGRRRPCSTDGTVDVRSDADDDPTSTIDLDVTQDGELATRDLARLRTLPGRRLRHACSRRHGRPRRMASRRQPSVAGGRGGRRRARRARRRRRAAACSIPSRAASPDWRPAGSGGGSDSRRGCGSGRGSRR